jgi:hypothetical protein
MSNDGKTQWLQPCAGKHPWYQKPETGPAGFNAGLSSRGRCPGPTLAAGWSSPIPLLPLTPSLPYDEALRLSQMLDPLHADPHGVGPRRPAGRSSALTNAGRTAREGVSARASVAAGSVMSWARILRR